MDLYSPYIKKYLNDVKNADYAIDDNGSQLSKRIGRYVILITDLSVRGMFADTKTLLIWIKNTESKTIEREILIKHELFPLPFDRVEKHVRKTIIELTSRKTIEYAESPIKEIIHDISI